MDVKCPMCEGKGYVLGPVMVQADEDDVEEAAPHEIESKQNPQPDHEELAPIEGVVEGSFPCERCNGDGVETVWVQECVNCGGKGVVLGGYGEETCSRCLGSGITSLQVDIKANG